MFFGHTYIQNDRYIVLCCEAFEPSREVDLQSWCLREQTDASVRCLLYHIYVIIILGE